MVQTTYGPNHPMAVKLWAKRLFIEALRETFVQRFIGSDEKNSIVYMKDETSKSAGDTITVGLRVQLQGSGTAGDAPLEGNEEALSIYATSLIIDQLRHAVRSGGKMSEQRVPFSVRQEAMDGLKDWWADRLDTWFFNQMCGYTPQTDVRFTGMQSIIAPDTYHQTWPNAKTNDQSLVAADNLTLQMVDQAIAHIKTNWAGIASGLVPIRPIRYKGGEYFILFIHPFQTYQLRQQTNPGQWADIQKARVIGGEGSRNNPIFEGGSYVGIYNQCVIHEDARVPLGVNTTNNNGIANVRRAVIAGAQALTIATGRDEGTPEKVKWVEELFDYNNQLGVSAGLIGGMKKMTYNGYDFGTYVLSSYSPPP